MKKHCLACFLILITICTACSQTTVFFQGFENAAPTCTENWGYTGGVRNSENNRTGSFAARVGRLSESNTLTFNTVSISGLSGVALQVYHSVRSGTGPGMDTREGAAILVSLNGGAYSAIGQIGGFGDSNYSYATNPGGAGSASSGCTVYTCANPLNYNVPAGTTSIAMKVVSVGLNGSTCTNYNSAMTSGTASNYDRNDEGFFIDDVKLTTTTTAIPGIWTGAVSTDWFDCNNWQNRFVPNTNTPVTIDQTASNDCVVGSAGAVCASIGLSSNSGTVRNLIVQNSGTLVCSGNVTVTKTVTNANLKLTLLNSAVFTCNNLTLTGTGSGQENAQFENEVSTSVLATINGNMTINNGGKLDLTNSPTYGILHIHGDYINNGLETDFKQTNSYVHLDGTGTQNINTNNFTEVFSNLVVNKSSGTAYLQDDIEIEQQLNMQAGPLNLNAKTATVDNGATAGIIRTSGYVISENSTNLSKLVWKMGNITGAHVFPFGKVSGYYIPFTFNLTSGTIGDVTLSTYSTTPANTPYPTAPNSVNDVNDAMGNDNSANVVDRFWQIDKTGSGTATLTFTYDDAEVPANGEANMIAQRYADSPIEAWQTPLTGQSANAAANTVTVPAVSTFSPWTLSSNLITLPAELLDFRGVWLSKKRTLLNWQVAAQTDVDHYIIEKSSDGKSFVPFATVRAVDDKLDYSLSDSNPGTVNYYGLYSMDKNGYKKFMRTILLLQPDELSDIIETQDVFYILNCAGCKAEIVDISGQVIQTSPVDENYQYTKQSLLPGIYFLRLYEGGNTVTKKFVVF
jgi:hypothetical protein